jgi:hypothetical protein
MVINIPDKHKYFMDILDIVFMCHHNDHEELTMEVLYVKG